MGKQRRFEIVGIKPPGAVDIYPFGEVRLHELSDERLEEILKTTSCEFIQEVPSPKLKPIVVEKPGKGKKEISE